CISILLLSERGCVAWLSKLCWESSAADCRGSPLPPSKSNWRPAPPHYHVTSSLYPGPGSPCGAGHHSDVPRPKNQFGIVTCITWEIGQRYPCGIDKDRGSEI